MISTNRPKMESRPYEFLLQFHLLAVQGTFGSLLQHHNSKASILWCSAFFTVQLSQLYVTTGKTLALTIQTFVRRGMALLSNTLSRLVIAFDFVAAVTVRCNFGAQEEEIYHYFHVPLLLAMPKWGWRP